MVLSASQQVALAFTAVLFTFVVLPRMFGVGGGGGGGTGAKDARLDSRYSRKGPGPGAVRGNPIHMNSPGAQSAENIQNMKKLMEQELKTDKYKSNSNKGYVFTLMPLYAIGVGVFAAYKFLKIKSADDQAQKEKLAKGAKKSVEAENQLNELEQRLAQTERMLNSILTQLDPLTNCVKSVAQDQKNEIMNQLQTIRYLMKKRGMDCPPLNVQDGACERNLDSLIESLGSKETPARKTPTMMQPISEETVTEEQDLCEKPPKTAEREEEEEEEGEQTAEEEQEAAELKQEEAGLDEDEEEEEEEEDMPLLEDGREASVEEIGAEPASGLRRRNRPE
ncbi:coiled-coil domain-containing protein 107 [Boleophthalmus pectinirostris]|uniref:coiled-coil domain-containing protein 107 n=1 Tax=Boleophthalmus pectinirostris TaxID=150288 RepID=UPI0024322ADF|nr:coiled-coil domain-containing protein 107 [Boleophthalmus pectinirostris]XP_055015975.1 coiled-coil domain-containing protein 107 [Boleophthalmus pectinirostris]